VVKAIGLVSGGLDSTLALMVMKEHGVEVDAVNFYTGFCVAEHRRKMVRLTGRNPARNEALRAGADAGVPIQFVDVSADYLPVVAHPKYGYGSAMNPCIDCRIFMLRKARERMSETGAKFVFTGEVLGQRPMSQRMNQLKLIEKESGLKGYLLRPLSAKLLDPTVPEEMGWVDRENLYAIKGRGRKEQVRLAAEFGIADYPQPAGGCCFLTDKSYARRLRDLFEHKGKDSVTGEDIILLKVGRHFRLSETAKAIVGRNEEENGFLARYAEKRRTFRALGFEGPLTLIEGEADGDDRLLAAQITARYSDGRGQDAVRVETRSSAGSAVLEVGPIGQELEEMRI